MKILVVNPAEYGFTDMVSRASLISTPRVASVYKKRGHDVAVYNIRPDLIGNRCKGNRPNCGQCNNPNFKKCSNSWRLIDEELYYKQEKLLTPIGERRCGNWNNEHLSRTLVRIGRPIDGYIKKLIEFKPDIVAISQVFTYLWEGIKEVIDVTRNVSPTTKIWVGGMYPTLCPNHAATLGADEVVTKSQGCIDDFTWIDLSVCEELPIVVGLFTQLGCPNNCGYCAVPIVEGRNQIRRTPSEVLDEIDYYVSHGINQIEFLDSNLLVNYESHFKLILEGIIQRRWKLILKSYGGVEAKLLTQDMLNLMTQAGFVNISIPIESASPELLKQWGRKVHADIWKNKMHSFGRELFINSFVLIGCLNQKIQQVEDTIKIVEDAGVHPVPLPFTPIPKTQEYENTIKVFQRDFTLENLHPILYPLATVDFTVEQMNQIYKRFHQHSLQGYGNVKYRGTHAS